MFFMKIQINIHLSLIGYQQKKSHKIHIFYKILNFGSRKFFDSLKPKHKPPQKKKKNKPNNNKNIPLKIKKEKKKKPSQISNYNFINKKTLNYFRYWSKRERPERVSSIFYYQLAYLPSLLTAQATHNVAICDMLPTNCPTIVDSSTPS